MIVLARHVSGGSRPRLSRPRAALLAARQAGRSGLVAARRLSGAQGMLPGLLVAGAQRGGTTSMVRALAEHPALVSAARYQEVHYFDTGYHRGQDWYRSHFPRPGRAAAAGPDGSDRGDRAGAGAGGAGGGGAGNTGGGAVRLAFESSPYYMFHPLAAARIGRDLPGVKVLVMLRNPAERAYSGWAHETSMGLETEPFERALELEASRLAGEAERIAAEPGYASYRHQHYAYRARGEYSGQLARLEQAVGRDRMHVVDSAAFFTDPGPVYAGVLEFLGLPAFEPASFRARNASPRAPLPPAIRAALDEHYRPHDERLASWLGYPPSWRR